MARAFTPVDVFALQGATLLTYGRWAPGLAMLVGDSFVARPSLLKGLKFPGLAVNRIIGTWPNDAWLLATRSENGCCSHGQLYHWDRTSWRKVLETPDATFATDVCSWKGESFALCTTEFEGRTWFAPLGGAKGAAPSFSGAKPGSRGCKTALHVPVGSGAHRCVALGPDRLLVFGSACDSQPHNEAIELWSDTVPASAFVLAPRTCDRRALEIHSVLAVPESQALFASGAATNGNWKENLPFLVEWKDSRWTPIALPRDFQGTVRGTTLGADGTLWAAADASILRYDGQWAKLPLPDRMGAAQLDGVANISFTHDGYPVVVAQYARRISADEAVVEYAILSTRKAKSVLAMPPERSEHAQ